MHERGGDPTLGEERGAEFLGESPAPGARTAAPEAPTPPGSTAQPSQDRRQSRRFSTPEERREATLRSGDHESSATLLNESSTGFAVLCDQHPGVFEGETVWLKTVAGWETVSVVSITSEPAGVRIGMRRLNDAGPAPAKQSKLPRDAEPPSNRLRVVVGLTLVLTLTAVPLVRSSLLDPLRGLMLYDSDGRSPDGLPLPEAPLPANASVEEVLHQLGPKVFSKKEIQQLLKMSPNQVGKLRRIERDCNHAVNMATLGGSSPETVAHLRRNAYQDVLKALNKQQRAVWFELVRRLQSRQAGYLWQKEAREEAAADRAFE